MLVSYIRVTRDSKVWQPDREAIRQWFSLVTSSLVKIIAESPHSWQKIVIHGNSCIILYIFNGDQAAERQAIDM